MKYTAIFLTLIILLTGCNGSSGNKLAGGDNSFKDAPSKVVYNAQPSSKVFLHSVKPTSLNPLTTSFSSNKDVATLVFEPLISVKKDYSISLKLAEGYIISEQGKRLTLNLRSNAKWHDGSDFSAADVVYTYNQILENAETNAYFKNIENIESLTNIGNSKIEITLKTPDSGFVRLLDFPIIKNKSVKENSFNYVGTGMYKIENYTVNSVISLKANLNWWGGVVNIPEIDVNLVPDISTSYNGFKMNSLDAAVVDYANSGKYSISKEIVALPSPSNRYSFISVNTDMKLLSDAVLRKIIKNIVSTEKIETDLIPGYSAIASSPVNPSASYAIKDKPIEDIKEELDKNGYVQGEASRVKEIDEREYKLIFDLLVNEESPSSVMLGEHAANSLQKYGIMVSVVKKSGETYANAAISGLYDFVVCETEISPNYDLSFLLGTDASLNIGKYSSEKMDTTLMLIKSAENEETRAKYFQDLQNIFFADTPHIPLCFYYKNILYNSTLFENVETGNIGDELDAMNIWGIKTQ